MSAAEPTKPQQAILSELANDYATVGVEPQHSSAGDTEEGWLRLACYTEAPDEDGQGGTVARYMICSPEGAVGREQATT